MRPLFPLLLCLVRGCRSAGDECTGPSPRTNAEGVSVDKLWLHTLATLVNHDTLRQMFIPAATSP